MNFLFYCSGERRIVYLHEQAMSHLRYVQTYETAPCKLPTPHLLDNRNIKGNKFSAVETFAIFTITIKINIFHLFYLKKTFQISNVKDILCEQTKENRQPTSKQKYEISVRTDLKIIHTTPGRQADRRTADAFIIPVHTL